MRAATPLLKPRPAALILCSVLAFNTGAEAASFDCGRAFTLVEKAICSNGELSGLDDTLASLYRQALGNSQAPDRLKTSQRAWMKRRDACQNERCLKAAYTKRIAEFDTRSSPASGSIGTAVTPTRPGDCVDTSILGKTTRFKGSKPGEPGGEAIVRLANGIALYIVSIGNLSPAIDANVYMVRTRDFGAGDQVRLCLVSLPENCPPGDDRGKNYSVTSKKNQKSFNGIDSWHLCGGA